jgi:hypothetical protein
MDAKHHLPINIPIMLCIIIMAVAKSQGEPTTRSVTTTG